jgi:GNAT superfamily N-acetyltransferase
MVRNDIDLGLRLKDQAGWNQTPADWSRFLALEPAGCFVAELDGRPVGTATTCVLGSVGWIAMVLVDAAARHQGIGTQLVTRATAYLQQRAVQTMRLDATALGRPVYQRLGFTAEYELVRWAGRPAAGSNRQRTEMDVVVPSAEQQEALAAIDQQATGTDRRRLLARLWQEQPQAVAVAVLDDCIQGYAMFRGGSRSTHLGPAAAMSTAAGHALLEWACNRCTGKPIQLDIPRDNLAASDWARSCGLEPQREFTRMVQGQSVQDQPQLLWASSGPEKG